MGDEVKNENEKVEPTEPTEPKKEGVSDWQKKIEQKISDLENLFKTKEPETGTEPVQIPVPKPKEKEPEPQQPTPTPEIVPQEPKQQKKSFLSWLL